MKNTIIMVVVLVALAIGYVLFTSYLAEKQVVVEPKPTAAEWCFQKTMPYGGDMTFGENQAGNYQYQLYAAKDGVEVWVPCE